MIEAMATMSIPGQMATRERATLSMPSRKESGRTLTRMVISRMKTTEKTSRTSTEAH